MDKNKLNSIELKKDETNLQALVQATNASHAYANSLYDSLITIFTPLVGQKIVKIDGTLIAKYQKMLPQLPNTPKLQVFKSTEPYLIAFTVLATEYIPNKVQHGWEQAYTDLQIGSIKNQILVDIFKKPNLKTDYTVEYVREKQKIAKLAQQQLSEANISLYPFTIDS